MLQISFDWVESMSLDRFPRSGMMQSGRLYPLNNSEHHTCESDGFVLPTPPTEERSNPIRPSRFKRRAKGIKTDLGPAILEWKNVVLPTPRAGHHHIETPLLRQKRIEKHGAIASSLGNSILDAFNQPFGKDIRIHPHFVEWMMGFPIDHTALKP